ncbi:UNVERIFIED_CONTAM: FIST C-terminal domain-containing protein, partial [Salmonella enterica]
TLEGDPQPALRALRATLAGLVDEGARPTGRTGHFGTDVRVRHLVGLDPMRQGVALADKVEEGMQLAFCQRNVAAARADLMRICAEIREELAPEAEPAAPPPLAGSEREIEHHPLASDIQYCLSKIHMNEGRLGESLRFYKRHVAQTMRVVHQAAQRGDAPAGGSAPQDTVGLRLPPRYRAAYRYIIEHLQDASLSVREIAGRLGVTERALQLAFRNHLGMTPAELIRRERVRRIEGEMEEASATGGRVHMLEVASRWGISNRSTLSNAFKLSSARV